MKFAITCAMFFLLGLLLTAADIWVDMWQYHAITTWGVVLVGIWRTNHVQ